MWLMLLAGLAQADISCSYRTTYDVVRDLHRAASVFDNDALVDEIDRIVRSYGESLHCLEHTPDAVALVHPLHLAAELTLERSPDLAQSYLLAAVRMAPDVSPDEPLQVDLLWDRWTEARAVGGPTASIRTRVPVFVDGRFLAAGATMRLASGSHLIQSTVPWSLQSRRLDLTARSDVLIDGRARRLKLGSAIAGSVLVAAGITSFSFFGQRAAHAAASPRGLGWTMAPAIAGGTLTALGVGTVVAGAHFEPHGASGLVITGRF